MAAVGELGSQGSATSSSSVATISSLDFNAEAADRIIAAHITFQIEGVTISSVTIGGVTPYGNITIVETTHPTQPDVLSALYYAEVPTGTSGSVVVTLSSGDGVVGVTTYSVTGADTTPTDTDSVAANAASVAMTALTIPTDGVGIAGLGNGISGTAITWTGATEQIDVAIATDHRHSSALVTTEGTNTITADGGTQSHALVGVAFGPASGVNEELSGTAINGAATVAGALNAQFALAGVAITGTATVTGALAVQAALTGNINGSATVSGDLSDGAAATPLGPGWGERTYRLEWRDRKWVKRKEREDELSNLIRQVYGRLAGEEPEEVLADEDAESVEAAAAEVAQVLEPFKANNLIDWQKLEANTRAIANLEDALDAYIKARDEEEDLLLLTAA